MNGNWHRQKTDYRERIRGCNCIFIIENKGSLMEIMTPNGIVNYINTFVKRAGCKSFFKVPSKTMYYCKWPPEIMMVPLKYMAASAPLK